MQSNAARAGVFAALVAVAVVLFIVLSGGDDSDSDPTTTTEQSGATVTALAEPVGPQRLEIDLSGGEPVGGVQELEVEKGDKVVVSVSSDEDGDLHIHGYEIEDQLTAGETTQVKFTADIDGKFEIEAHSHATGDIPLADLTVQP